MQRRNFLALLSGALATVLITPITAFAAIWNKSAFDAVKLAEALKHLNIQLETASPAIVIIAPDKAENGAIVQVEVKSNIADTESIAIFVEKNPTPLIAHVKFSSGAEPFLVTRIKMAETSEIKVVVQAGNQHFTHAKHVIVLENGCG